MSNPNKEDLSTTDTPLAAHLLTEGFILQDIRFNDGRASFIFANDSIRLSQCRKEFELIRATSSNAHNLIQNYISLIQRAKRGF